MNYVVALCEAVDKTRAGTDADPMLEVSSTMPDLEEVCRVSLSTWNNDYKGMKKMLTLIETQAAAARETPFKGDAFSDVMEPFLQHATGVINELGKQYDRAVKFFEDTLVLFAEDPKKVACEDFFGDLVLGFTRAFDKARNQNEKKRLMAEKASKQKVRPISPDTAAPPRHSQLPPPHAQRHIHSPPPSATTITTSHRRDFHTHSPPPPTAHCTPPATITIRRSTEGGGCPSKRPEGEEEVDDEEGPQRRRQDH